MKLTLFFIIFLLFNENIFADESDPKCQECRSEFDGSHYKKMFEYKICNPVNNSIINICTTDPYNLPAPYTGWKPMKLCLPLNYGTSITYNNEGIPYSNLGPWKEQTYLGQYSDYEFHDGDVPLIIQSAMDYWQNICSPYNNEDCQACPIKVVWTKDATKLGVDKLRPSHITSEISGNNCSYDCSKLAIILNGTSGFSSLNSNGKPLKYFITRGTFNCANYLVNTDLRTEMMHQLGSLLGFGNTTPDDGCGSEYSMMSTPSESGGGGTYWEVQDNRSDALSSESSSDPPYNFIHSQYLHYDECIFRLLYCCEPTVSVNENKEEYDNKNGIEDVLISLSDSREVLNVNIKGTNSIDGIIIIYNLIGQISIFPIKMNSSSNINHFEVDISTLTEGVYFVVYRNHDYTINKVIKIIK